MLVKNDQLEADRRNYRRDYSISDRDHKNLPTTAIRLNGFQFAFCLAGEIKMRVEGRPLHYKKGTFSIFRPYNLLEVDEVSEDFASSIIMFQRSFLMETLNNIYFLERFHLLHQEDHLPLTLRPNQQLHVLEILQKIKQTKQEEGNRFKSDIIRSYLIILLYELENAYLNQDLRTEPQQKLRRGKEKVKVDFQELLFKHAYKERKVSFYANALHLSLAQFSTIIRISTGRSPKQHIDDIRLAQAKQLLKSGRYNVSEVAALLYYDNLEEFSRFFKKKSGTTAWQYMKSD